MKKCPFCAEEIQDEAIRCKHCKSMLNKTERDKPSNPKNKLAMIVTVVVLLVIVGVMAAKQIRELNKTDADKTATSTTATTTKETVSGETAKVVSTTPKAKATATKTPKSNITPIEIEYGQKMLGFIQQSLQGATGMLEYCTVSREQRKQFTDETINKMSVAMATAIVSYNKAKLITPPNQILEIAHEQALNGLKDNFDAAATCLNIPKATDEADHAEQVGKFLGYIADGQKRLLDASAALDIYAVILY